MLLDLTDEERIALFDLLDNKARTVDGLNEIESRIFDRL